MNLENNKVSSTRIWILISAGLVAAGGAAWSLWDGVSKEEGVAVPEAFSVESMKANMNKPENMTVRRLSSKYQELTDEQRRQVRQNKDQAFREIVQDHVDEYFAAGDEDRDAIMDRHLEEIMEQWEQKKSDAEDQQPESRKGASQVWSRQERKEKSESADPDRMAQWGAYKTAMMKRAQARGMVWSGQGGKSSGKRGP